MKKIALLGLILFLCGSSVLSYQIDDIEEQCLANSKNNEDMIKCTKIAQESWQKEIDKNYSSLKSLMNRKDFDNLKQSQKEWEQFKKSEFDSIESVIKSRENSVNTVFLYEDFKKGILKQRAITLFEYNQVILDSHAD